MTINELVLAMKRIQKLPDDTKLQRIAEFLDEDHDGNVDIDDALKVHLLPLQQLLSTDLTTLCFPHALRSNTQFPS